VEISASAIILPESRLTSGARSTRMCGSREDAAL